MIVFLESFQVLLVLVIFLLFIWGGKLTRRIQIRGWKFLVIGVFFVWLGEISDLLGEFESLKGIIPVKEGNFFEYPGAAAGISLGLLFVAAGLLLVIPSVYVVLYTKTNIEQSDKRYKLITENITDVVFLVDLNFNWLYITPSVLKFRGYTAEEALQQNISDVMTPASIKLVKRIVRREIMRDKTPGLDPNRVQSLELEFYHKNGSKVWGEVTATTLRDEDGRIVGLQGINRNITDIRQTQVALKESEEKLRSTLEAIGDCVIMVDRDFNIIWSNDRAMKKLGTVPGIKCYQAAMGIEELCTGCETRSTFKDGKVRTWEMQFNTFQKRNGSFLVTCAPVRNSRGEITSVVQTIKDINDLKMAEARLVKTIEEKESLLKEIHHRVKNNLQAISGLLDIQALRSDDSKSRTAIRESQNRILSMALIHEHLYQHQDMSCINFTGYTRHLAMNLMRSYGTEKQFVEIDVNGDDIVLNPDTAIPCSLILTELVSNALQHAFSDGDGKIVIGLEDEGKKRFKMSVTDNGGSLPKEIDINSTESFGLMLVRTFVDLLDGKIEVISGDETAFIITFREYEEAHSIIF